MELDKYANATSYLIGSVRSQIGSELGVSDNRYDWAFEARLIGYFENAIHYEGCQRFFLVGGGKLYVYDGRCYRSEGYAVEALQAMVKKVLRTIGVGPMYEQRTYKKIAVNCLDAMRFEPASQFIPDRRYIVFKNLVLDTVSRKCFDFSMRFRTDVVLDFEYRADRSCLWDRVIAQTIPNEEMREAFQSFCGAFLTNRKDYSIEYICYLIGRGRNGKSVVTGAIANMLGETLVSNYSPQELFKDSDKKYNRAGLVGKLVNFSDDVSRSDFAGGLFKQFVSGHRISARQPYGQPFDLEEIPFLCCCVNEMPPTSDNSLGHNRRILPIVCPNKISEDEADPQLLSKLSTEDSKIGIFNWVLQGLWRLRDNQGRIVLGESVRQLQTNVAIRSSSVYSWIHDSNIRRSEIEKPDRKDAGWKPLREWVALYAEWCSMMREPQLKTIHISNAFKELELPRYKGNRDIFYHADSGYAPTEEETQPQEKKIEEADIAISSPDDLAETPQPKAKKQLTNLPF